MQFNFSSYEEYCAGLTDEQLRFSIDDCQGCLAVWRDHPNAEKYLDQINVAVGELLKRSNNNGRKDTAR